MRAVILALFPSVLINGLAPMASAEIGLGLAALGWAAYRRRRYA